MRQLATAPMVAVLLVCGCVPSFHPLYTENELVFEPALIGKWTSERDLDTLVFEENGKDYRLTLADQTGEKLKTGTFSAHLLKLDDAMYLDLYPEPPKLEAPDLYKGNLIRMHTFLRVKQVTPTLRIAMIDRQWLEKHLDESPNALRHELREPQSDADFGLIITASTAELQAFFRKHAETKELFGELAEFRRITPEGGSRQPGK
jgi:hypothetical protein